MNKSLFISASEVSAFLSISMSKAYKIIQSLNAELKEMGYITVSGKTNRKYFESKIYGDNSEVQYVS